MAEFLPEEETTSEEIRKIAELVVYDGLPIGKVPKSAAAQKYFSDWNVRPPKDPKTVEKAVVKYAKLKKTELKLELFDLMLEGCKFSAIATPWKHLNGKSFINLKLTGKTESYNLGFIPVSDDLKVIDYSVLVRNKLKDFGILLTTQLVSCTQINTSFMNKYSIQGGVITQFCYNQAIHLAFLKTFCLKLQPRNSHLLSYGEGLDEQSDNNYSDGNLTVIPFIRSSHVLRPHVRELFSYVKKLFRDLENYLSDNENDLGIGDNELNFDESRWDTAISGIWHFVSKTNKLKNFMRLDEIDERKLDELNDICNIWNATREAVMDISVENDLYSAEKALIRLFKHLRVVNSVWSERMVLSLTETISKARNATLVTLYIYLVTNSFPITTERELPYSLRSDVEELAESLQNRLIGLWGFAEKLIAKGTENANEALFDLRSSLSTIKPAAIENCKVFTTADSYVDRFHTPLSFDVFDSIFFLKNYFRKEFQR